MKSFLLIIVLAFFSCYPNPFSENSIISFSIDIPTTGQFQLIDISGKEIWTWKTSYLTNGAKEFLLNIPELTSGIY